MTQFALFGGSGAIGQSVAAALRSKELPYRVVGRSASSFREFSADPLAEPVVWNPDDPASVRAAARGVNTIIYTVGVPYDQFQLHPDLMRKTLQGAVAEGARNVLLIGTVYGYGLPQTERIRETHPQNPHTFKGKMRKEQEDILMGVHARGELKATVLKLPDFYGPGVDKSFLYECFKAAVSGGTANIVGPTDKPHEFMLVPDVGPVVLALAEHPNAWGRTWHFAGAGVISLQEMAERIFKATGRKPKLRVAGKTMLRIAGLFNPFLRELVEMNYLLTNPVIMDDSALHALLGKIDKTPYDEGIRRTIESMRHAA